VGRSRLFRKAFTGRATRTRVAVMTEIRKGDCERLAHADAFCIRPSHRYPRFSRHKDSRSPGPFIRRIMRGWAEPLAAFAGIGAAVACGVGGFWRWSSLLAGGRMSIGFLAGMVAAAVGIAARALQLAWLPTVWRRL